MTSNHSYKLSIITATHNAIEHLPNLIECLRNQEDKDFEWVVADGASTDGTLELLKSIDDLNIVITSQEDFGIYDALNRGIKASSGEFYLVMGADDLLYPNAVRDYKDAIEDGVDIVTATIKIGDGVSTAGARGGSWFAAQFAYISGHAVGSIYRKSLHNKYGYYSRKFPIAADQLFILKSCKSGAKIKIVDQIVGEHLLVGVSSVDIIGSMSEYYRVQLDVGENKLLQTVLFILRLIKNYRKLNWHKLKVTDHVE
jgi:glycosyltransferase